jgi:hypothetical protein
VTCGFRATDDAGRVFYEVDWGDGPPQRVPPSGDVSTGDEQRAAHAWATPGQRLVRVTATDDGDPPLTSPQRATTQDVLLPPCELRRQRSLVAGLAGLEVDGVSAGWEGGIPEGCPWHAFTLDGSLTTDDFNVCWHDAAGTLLRCFQEPGPERGVIPAGAARARVIYYLGAAGTYRLTAT